MEPLAVECNRDRRGHEVFDCGTCVDCVACAPSNVSVAREHQSLLSSTPFPCAHPPHALRPFCRQGEQVTVPASSCFAKEDDSVIVDDMVRLAYLHEPGVLNNLMMRYQKNIIYVSGRQDGLP